jgi:hypothetical protein
MKAEVMNSLVIALATTMDELPSDDKFSAGWLGAVFFFGLAAAVVLLWRNMNARLKRLDKKRDEQ